MLKSQTWTWIGSSWFQRTVTTAPNARDAPAVATLNNDVVVFGGYSVVANGSTYVNDTWVWDGSAWAEKLPSFPPPARSGASAATLNGRMMVYGGAGPTSLGDTWVWDGSTWTNETPLSSPPARNHAAMATLGDKVFLFGGVIGDFEAATLANDTWAWDGVSWTQLHPPVSPSPREAAMMGEVSGRLILFGGEDDSGGASSEYLGDTWSWDGTTWTELHPVSSPQARGYGSAAGFGDTMLLFGGLWNGPMVAAGDTWVWDGSTWTQQLVGPFPDALQSSGGMSCYD